MKRTFITLSVVVFVVGCATRSILVGDTPKPISAANPEELRLVEIARQAVTSREGENRRSWADQATYMVRRMTNGWSVWVLKTRRDLLGRPHYPPHRDRWVQIDEQGKVTGYFGY
jgi:hypothetical protein